jgi:hypothetical protein
MPHSFFNQNAEKSRLHCSAPGYLRPSVGGEPFTPDIVKTGLARKATGMPSLGEERINIYSIIVISADQWALICKGGTTVWYGTTADCRLPDSMSNCGILA